MLFSSQLGNETYLKDILQSWREVTNFGNNYFHKHDLLPCYFVQFDKNMHGLYDIKAIKNAFCALLSKIPSIKIIFVYGEKAIEQIITQYQLNRLQTRIND